MRWCAALALVASQAWSQGLPGSETVVLRVDNESIYAHLFKAQAKGRRPAMVLVHGFDGVSEAREGFWARELSALGISTLVIESFSARGAASSLADQSGVSTGQGLRDAQSAAAYLTEQPYVDAARIGIMGMSRGGTVALRAVDKRRQVPVRPFAAAVALYPGCVAQYRNPQPSAPILVLIGEADDYTRVKSCADYLGRMRAAGGRAELKLYRGAHHGFDGDTAQGKVFMPQAQNLSECLLYIEDDGGTTYAKTGARLDSARAAIELMRADCIRQGATVAADARVKRQALEDVKAFLKGNLL